MRQIARIDISLRLNTIVYTKATSILTHAYRLQIANINILMSIVLQMANRNISLFIFAKQQCLAANLNIVSKAPKHRRVLRNESND